MRAARKTVYQTWDATWAKLLLSGDGWTPPAQVKIVYGVRSGTATALFRDDKGQRVEAYCRFRLTVTGLIHVSEQGLRKSFRGPVAGASV